MIDIYQGGCLCGRVRYRTVGAPIAGTVCPCKLCQWESGEAAR
jgi:hypothetical protein